MFPVSAGWVLALLGLPAIAAWLWAYRTHRRGLTVLLAWGLALLSTGQALASAPGYRLLPTVVTIGWVIAAVLGTWKWSHQSPVTHGDNSDQERRT